MKPIPLHVRLSNLIQELEAGSIIKVGDFHFMMDDENHIGIAVWGASEDVGDVDKVKGIGHSIDPGINMLINHCLSMTDEQWTDYSWDLLEFRNIEKTI